MIRLACLAACTIPCDRLATDDPWGIDRRPGWVHPAEWSEAAILTDRRRRWQWLTGRLAAKRLVQTLLPAPPALAAIAIRSRDAQATPTPPRVFIGGQPVDIALSISHGADHAAAVAARGAGRRIGVDLAPSTPRGPGWRWALYEAALKAANRPDWTPQSLSIERREACLLARNPDLAGGFVGQLRRFAAGRWILVGGEWVDDDATTGPAATEVPIHEPGIAPWAEATMERI